MSTETAPGPAARAQRWAGRILSGLLIAFLVFDSTIKLIPIAPVMQTMGGLGYSTSPDFARWLGVLTLACTALYAFPRTALPGAVLLTGLFGGAIASQLRIDAPLFSHTLFGVYLGLFAWCGLFLRDPRLRAMVALRARTPSAERGM